MARHILALIIGLTLVIPPATARAQDDMPELDAMIATEIARFLRATNASTLRTRDVFDSAIALADLTVELDPDNLRMWQTYLETALHADDDERRALAIREMNRLDPSNETIRLMRLQDAINAYQSVDERARAFEKFLHPDNRFRLGPAVTSRLAFDYALMLRRAGDSEGFATWLAESTAIDPSNRSAAALAAGYFQHNVDDTYGAAELLTNVLLADPSDTSTLLTLSQTLLEGGAYRGAARMYMLSANASKLMRSNVQPGVLTDACIAAWGAGRTEDALALIKDRQFIANVTAQNMKLSEDQSLTRIDVGNIVGVLETDICLVRAAIHTRAGTGEQQNAYEQLRTSYAQAVNRMLDDRDASAEAVAQLFLEQAAALLWFGYDVDTASAALEEADALVPLSDAARARYEALIALRENQPERALEVLGDLSNSDDMLAMLVFAEACASVGRTRDAAEAYLLIGRTQPGTVMGVWSQEALTTILGRRVPISETAERLETLIESIPKSSDRHLLEPSTMVSMRLEPVESTYTMFGPMLLRVTITNHSGRPIGIDTDGPIRPQIALFATARMANFRGVEELPAMVIDIGRRLRLEPRESYTVIVDLRSYGIGQYVNYLPHAGALVRVRGFSNFVGMTNGELAAGLLGMRAESSTFRVDGVRIDNAWVRRVQQMTALQRFETIEQMKEVIALAHVVALGQTPDSPAALDIEPELIESSLELVIEAFGSMTPRQKALMLLLMPQNKRFEPILEISMQSDDRLLQIVHLLRGVKSEADPMLAAGARSDDPGVRAVASMMQTSFEMRGEAPAGLAPEANGAPGQ
ncbi:MAG: hypothetical protein AAF432_03745 [Planctomycetota bacterium]